MLDALFVDSMDFVNLSAEYLRPVVDKYPLVMLALALLTFYPFPVRSLVRVPVLLDLQGIGQRVDAAMHFGTHGEKLRGLLIYSGATLFFGAIILSMVYVGLVAICVGLMAASRLFGFEIHL